MATSGNTTDQDLTLAEGEPDASMAPLDSRHRDWLTPLAKGIVGACPFIGPMPAEIVGMTVPNQRVERVGVFLRTVDEGSCLQGTPIICHPPPIRLHSPQPPETKPMTQARQAQISLEATSY